jgi:hypothetical protein
MKVKTILFFMVTTTLQPGKFFLNALLTQSYDEFQQEMDMMQVGSGNRDIWLTLD